MSGSATLLAEKIPFPPSVEDFYLPSVVHGAYPWLTKFTLLVWFAAAVIIVFFMWAYRTPKIVPNRRQWLAESLYGFVRNNISLDTIGHEHGLRFAPYLATLFSFLLLTNLFTIIPGIQVSPNSHIAFPAMLAVISWVMFIYLGIRRHGFVGYLKASLILPAPWWIQGLLIPIEFFSTFLVRPFTLSVRLFANMFAGHVILLAFSLGGVVLLTANNLFLKPISILSFALAIALTGLELLVAVLQAYVFTVLTANYVQGALEVSH